MIQCCEFTYLCVAFDFIVLRIPNVSINDLVPSHISDSTHSQDRAAAVSSHELPILILSRWFHRTWPTLDKVPICSFRCLEDLCA